MNPHDQPIKNDPVPVLDKQAIIVMGLLLAAYMAYQVMVVVPREQARADWLAEQAKIEAQQQDDAAAQGDDPGADPAPVGTATPADAPEPADAPPVEAEEPATEPDEQLVTLETPEFSLALSNAGASVHELTFKHLLGSTYHAVLEKGESDDVEKTPYQPLHPYSSDVRSLGLEPYSGAGDMAWVGHTTRWKHTALAGGGHQFQLTLPNGLELTKTYTPPEARSEAEEQELPSYHFNLTVSVRNPTGEAQEFFGYWLNGPAGMEDRSRDRMAGLGSEAIITADFGDGEYELNTWQTTADEIQMAGEPAPSVAGDEAGQGISYFGGGTHYFVALVVPQEGVEVSKAEAMGLYKAQGREPTESERAPGKVGTLAVTRALVGAKLLAPNESVQHGYMIYVGPRQKKLLDNDESPYTGHGLEEVTDFGVFDSFASLLLTVLIGLEAIVGNWGFSVILLTFMVRGLMLPMSIWSQRNMLRMQKIAPEMQKLKEKYAKPDGSMTPEQQRQFSAAQMELMREHQVNPLGCAGPIFLQMPIFFGLWKALNYSFELRHTSFIGWITDLSAPDIVARLPGAIPLIGTDAVSILPLLMVVTYFLQQQIQPKASDPKQAEQQKMMKIIFPIFGLFLYKFPSGLMLYFITSALWSITEMATVKKWIQQQEAAPKGAKTAAAK